MAETQDNIPLIYRQLLQEDLCRFGGLCQIESRTGSINFHRKKHLSDVTQNNRVVTTWYCRVCGKSKTEVR